MQQAQHIVPPNFGSDSMQGQMVISALAFGGVFVASLGLLLSSSAQQARWVSALLFFLTMGTGNLCLRAVRTRQFLLGSLAGVAFVACAVGLLLSVTR